MIYVIVGLMFIFVMVFMMGLAASFCEHIRTLRHDLESLEAQVNDYSWKPIGYEGTHGPWSVTETAGPSMYVSERENERYDEFVSHRNEY